MTFPTTPAGFMSGQARRGWIANNIPRSTWENVPGNQILDALKNAGMGIRRQDFQGIRRDVLGLEKFERQLERVEQNSLVPRAYMQPRGDLSLTSQAQYRFRVSVVDTETGETEILSRAMATNIHYTKAEAEEFMRTLLAGPLVQYNLEIDELKIYEVWTREDARLTR